MDKKKKDMKRIFDIYFGWLFINGRKQEEWSNYLKDKYGDRFS